MSLQSGKRSCVSVMEFEWDEAKRLTNLRKHGIDFIDILAVFDGDTVTVEDDPLQLHRAAFRHLWLVARASRCCCPYRS
ncbi:MAG: BrnT family toxin [Nostoc sp.]